MKRVTAVVAATALAVPVVVGAGTAGASSASCAPASTLLSKKPSVTNLPAGAVMRAWDTGVTSDLMNAKRIVTVDVSHTVKLRGHVLRAGQLTTTATPTQLAARNKAAIAVLNGGVFDLNGYHAPSGAAMAGGVLLKASSSAQPVLVTTKAGRTTLGTLQVSGTAKLPTSSMAMSGLNDSQVNYTGVTVYTSAWGAMEVPRAQFYVTVTNGVVTSTSSSSYHSAPTASGVFLLAARNSSATVLSRLRVGAKVAVSYKAVVGTAGAPGAALTAKDPAVDAVGYSSRPLHTGIDVALCNSRNEELRPRTGVGIKANGDLFLMVSTGRVGDDYYRVGGATVHQFAIYMHQRGAVDGIIFDGGNSTELLVRRYTSGSVYRVDRSMSQFQREMPNCFAIIPR